MTAPSAATRAVLRLAQGESSARSWELVASSVQSTITVGSGVDCTWVVQGEGVHSRHFSLQWDGRRLLAADLSGEGGVTVRGEPLTSAWREVQGASDIHFGNATICVSIEVAPVAVGHPLDATAFGMPAHRPSPSRSAGARTQFGVGSPLNFNADADTARKETLMGVAPIEAESPGHAPSAPQGDAFRVIRPLGPTEKGKQGSNRTNGMGGATHFGYVVEHPPSQPQSSSGPEARPSPGVLEVVEPPDGTVQVVPAPAVPVAPMPIVRSGTLIGVAVPEIVHALRKKTSGASLGDDDQRTIQGHVAPAGESQRAGHASTVHGCRHPCSPCPRPFRQARSRAAAPRFFRCRVRRQPSPTFLSQPSACSHSLRAAGSQTPPSASGVPGRNRRTATPLASPATRDPWASLIRSPVCRNPVVALTPPGLRPRLGARGAMRSIQGTLFRPRHAWSGGASPGVIWASHCSLWWPTSRGSTCLTTSEGYACVLADSRCLSPRSRP